MASEATESQLQHQAQQQSESDRSAEERTSERMYASMSGSLENLILKSLLSRRAEASLRFCFFDDYFEAVCLPFCKRRKAERFIDSFSPLHHNAKTQAVQSQLEQRPLLPLPEPTSCSHCREEEETARL